MATPLVEPNDYVRAQGPQEACDRRADRHQPRYHAADVQEVAQAQAQTALEENHSNGHGDDR